jgi:hypothetical protein
MKAIATDLTREHYQRPEVRTAILRHCRDGEAWRALNGNDGWYIHQAESRNIRLSNSDDYEFLIGKYRTLYSTLDYLEPTVKETYEVWDKQRGAPSKPIGTLRECLAYTLSVDIDSIQTPDGKDITSSPEIKSAVETAGQFFVDYLKKHGITKSIHCLFSGGGIYIHVHHALFKALPEWGPDDREQAFRSITLAFNRLIGDVSAKFFEAHPEHEGKVKFDQLNNQKRKFKCIFSIHKRFPLAVIPLNPGNIAIDFDRARLPLSDEVLAEGQRWYRDYDVNEKDALKTVLAPYAEEADDELRERKARTGDYEVSRSLEPVPIDRWPPCMEKILNKVEAGRGPHRALAVLAAFLYQAGWPEDEAFKLWLPAADRADVETRIFDQWYGLMCCPSCKTIQKESAGYPKVGLGCLEYCLPNDICSEIRWPGDHFQLIADQAKISEFQDKIKTDPGAVYEPKIFQWLKEIFDNDPGKWERIKKFLRTAKISVRDLVERFGEGQGEEAPAIQMPFVEFDDGKLAEMVYRDGKTMFALFNPKCGQVEYFSELEHNGSKVIPLPNDELLCKGCVMLPTEAEDYGSELDLYNDIRCYIHKYLEISNDYEAMSAFYPMLSHVYDVMPVIVYLRARGDWGTGKSRFLAVFGSICHRPISATGAVTEAPIYRIMDKWRGTLILEEADFDGRTSASSAIAKILNCGYEQHKPVLRCDTNDPEVVHAFDAFSPKILATRFEFKDKALESRCFTEIMKERTRTDVPISLPGEFHQEALRLRNKLLMYRFKNRAKIKQQSENSKLKFDFSGLPDRMQQAARPLSVVVGDNPQLQEMLSGFLYEKERSLIMEASETLEGHLIRILVENLFGIDDNNVELIWNLTIGDVAERIKMATRDYRLTPARVRTRANSLGISTRLVWSGGKNQRFITCEKNLFDRLKRRYLPHNPHDTHDTRGEAGNARDSSSEKIDHKCEIDKEHHGSDDSCGSPDGALYGGPPMHREDCSDRAREGSQGMLDEVLVCHRIKKAIVTGTIDPTKLSETVGIPVCIAAKWSGVNTIAAEAVLAKIQEHRRDLHFKEKADRLTTGPKDEAKKTYSYADMVALVPPDSSSFEASKICRAFCILLKKGMAPRVDALVDMTGLPQDNILAYLNKAAWIRKDESSPGGIVVYLPTPIEA